MAQNINEEQGLFVLMANKTLLA